MKIWMNFTGLIANSFSEFKCVCSTFKRYGLKLRSVFNALKHILNAYQTQIKRVGNEFDLRFNEFKTSFFFCSGNQSKQLNCSILYWLWIRYIYSSNVLLVTLLLLYHTGNIFLIFLAFFSSIMIMLAMLSLIQEFYLLFIIIILEKWLN